MYCIGHGCPVQHKEYIGYWHVIKCAPKEADTKILYLQLQKNSSQARLLWGGFLPQKAVLLWFIHSLTLAQSCTSFYSLLLSFCVCFFRKENTREYGAPSSKHCVTTSQRGEQILLSHLWTSGKSVHAGNVCTVLMLELRKEYRTYLETNAFVEDTKFCQNWKVNWVMWV